MDISLDVAKKYTIPYSIYQNSASLNSVRQHTSVQKPLGCEPMAYAITVNSRLHEVDADGQTPLLWVLRDMLGLTGTKYGCGIAQCGACTVHVDGQPTRSCSLPLALVGSAAITTIEALDDPVTAAVQQAWGARDVPQCGFCQSGQVMSAVALLRAQPSPTDSDIDTAMSGNICRCATYNRIRAAIHDAATTLRGEAV